MKQFSLERSASMKENSFQIYDASILRIILISDMIGNRCITFLSIVCIPNYFACSSDIVLRTSNVSNYCTYSYLFCKGNIFLIKGGMSAISRMGNLMAMERCM
jgi:hypothetical protein